MQLKRQSVDSMKIHIFNPEHDIALATNLSNFTAPHAGRQLRHDIGFLPALWAEEGDVILVDDVEQAQKTFLRFSQSAYRHLGRSFLTGNYQFAPWKLPVSLRETTSIQPWGWDLALKARLKRAGIAESLLPTDDQLATIRQLSHRRIASRLLPCLQREGTIGESYECTSAEEVDDLLKKYGQLVMKAPWSSSGRGLRFLDVERTALQMQAGWLRNILQAQGSVMVEPFYHKVKDFAMEFSVSAEGIVCYEGLSLFHTANGAYTGNILATENAKREMISRYVSIELLDDIQERICRLLPSVLKGKYVGPFGVDMMICSGLTVHPCVEINLRRTMGHVALALSPLDDDILRVMRIEYADNNYKLKIQRL